MILDPRVAEALNQLIKGAPSLEFSPDGQDDWQIKLFNSIRETIPEKRFSTLFEHIKGRNDEHTIMAEIFAADRKREISKLPMTDTGNAEMIAELYGTSLRYDHKRKEWMVWEGQSWHRDDIGQVKIKAIEAIRQRQQIALQISDLETKKKAVFWAINSENSNHLNSSISISQDLYPIADNGEGWDENPWLLGCDNGVIDLKQGTLRAGSPNDRITLSTHLSYDASALCDRWLKFLQEIFDGNEIMIEFIQRSVGYCLTGDIREQVLFLCWGGGANGKSTFLTTLRSVLGEYAFNTPFNTFEMNIRDHATNDIANLCGSRLVTASETSESMQLNEARVKAITGGDPVTSRFLFSEFFTYQPTYKIWLAMNHLPTIKGTDEGIWRRVRLIPFTRTFTGQEQDKTLGDKLKEERAGILAWAVKGALKWQVEGMFYPQDVIAATEQYRDESDIVGEFLKEFTVKDEKAITPAKELYKLFINYCIDNGIKHPISRDQFSRNMTDHGFKTSAQSGKRVVRGLGLPVF